MKFLPPRDAHFLLISDFFLQKKDSFLFSTEVADLMIFMHEDLVDSNFIIFCFYGAGGCYLTSRNVESFLTLYRFIFFTNCPLWALIVVIVLLYF
jgi:hypothetical protein